MDRHFTMTTLLANIHRETPGSSSDIQAATFILLLTFVVGVGALVLVRSIRSRFSLRTLFITATAVAVILGLIMMLKAS